jgi:hypothetical protein
VQGGQLCVARKVYTPCWGDKPNNLRTDNAVVTKDQNKVTSDGVIKSGHHIAHTTGTGKNKCRNTGTDEQMAQVTPISKNEENECKVTQSTRNMNKWNY